jgi:membrane protease subunit HflC
MRSGFVFVAVIAAVVAAVGLISTFGFIVTEREQIVVTRLNRPIRVIVGSVPEDQFASLAKEIADTAVKDQVAVRVDRGAGLYFRIPFTDSVERFPDTVMEYDAEPEDIITADKKKLIVDNFARWRIENPLMFRIRVRTEVAARGALDDIIYSVVREELGKNNLIEVIRTSNRQVGQGTASTESVKEGFVMENPLRDPIKRGREAIMKNVAAAADKTARQQYGIRVLDVRIKRAELLPENLQAVFARMEAERSRISKGYRSEGHKQANMIEGAVDRRVKIILANAQRDATTMRGEGDAEAIRIFAEAFNSNPDLYRFMQSLDVLKDGTPSDSELVIGLDSSIFKFLKSE